MSKIAALMFVLLFNLVGCDDASSNAEKINDAGTESQLSNDAGVGPESRRAGDAGVNPDSQVVCTPSSSMNGMPVFQDCQGSGGKIGTCFQKICCFGCLKFNLIAGVPQFYACQDDGSSNSSCGSNGSTCDECETRGQQCLKSVGGTYACFL